MDDRFDEPSEAWPFHTGEQQAQACAQVHGLASKVRRFVRPYMPDQHREFYASLPFMVVAARDEGERPWVTFVWGTPGFVRSPTPTTLHVDARPDAADALADALVPGVDVGLLGIELATRRRNRINGRIMSGEVGALEVQVGQSFGNCPKYITPRTWQAVARPGSPPSAERHATLDARLTRWIEGADTLFIASGYAGQRGDRRTGMDASHRGGEPGFVVVRDERTVVIPDYAGNNFFNTIGNLMVDPRVGLLFVDFETGSLLQLTGRAAIDWATPDAAKYPGAKRLVVVTVDEVVVLPEVLPMRAD
ncbi:MAG: pyridoxamine 5'-phosphate oxidase family protein [Myxococcota bacterium]